MKNLISNPILLKELADKLYNMLNEFDIICGIPDGGMLIASYISFKYNKPMIYLRDKTKKFAGGNLIEGKYNSKSRCVIVDDILITGNTLNSPVKYLKSKLCIVDVAVLMHTQELFSNLIHDWRVKSVLYKNDYTKYRLQSIRGSKNTHICFAADIEDPVRLLDVVKKIGPFICVCKIHYDIINTETYNNSSNQKNYVEDLIKLSIEYNFLIMEDRKLILLKLFLSNTRGF